jgi:hypothetical protein
MTVSKIPTEYPEEKMVSLRLLLRQENEEKRLSHLHCPAVKVPIITQRGTSPTVHSL